jgi:hypothetical protein
MRKAASQGVVVEVRVPASKPKRSNKSKNALSNPRRKSTTGKLPNYQEDSESESPGEEDILPVKRRSSSPEEDDSIIRRKKSSAPTASGHRKSPSKSSKPGLKSSTSTPNLKHGISKPSGAPTFDALRANVSRSFLKAPNWSLLRLEKIVWTFIDIKPEEQPLGPDSLDETERCGVWWPAEVGILLREYRRVSNQAEPVIRRKRRLYSITCSLEVDPRQGRRDLAACVSPSL